MQPIYNIAEICAQKGVKHVVLCPGSRCAPLTLAFNRQGSFSIKVMSDERSAAFVALGIAQESKRTVILICTSGSALYNFAPAVSEAHFAGVPLLILSADRPTEWIGQQDGQTIFQQGIFGKHVKRFFQLPQEYNHADNAWAINRSVNEALNLTNNEQPGPVHINIPLREPLYPAPHQTIHFEKDVRLIKDTTKEFVLSDEHKALLTKHWKQYNKVLVVAGQQPVNSALTQLLQFNIEKHSLPAVADIIANQHKLTQAIKHADAFLGQAPESLKESLQPELLITFGSGTIAKQLKLFLRKYKAVVHWHIGVEEPVADTYQSLTHVAPVLPEVFFTFLSTLDKKENFDKQKKENYLQVWQLEEQKAKSLLTDFFPTETLGEFEIVKEVMQQLPADAHLHLANSMSVRYANYVGLSEKQGSVQVFANRGTSGIDGCTSTVVGHCLANPEKLQVLITGDIAFFYDRNAFWHSYALPNLRILLLNNHGGVIFKLIDGPADLKEVDEFFVAKQKLSAKHLCAEFGIDHLIMDSRKKINNQIKNFFENDGTPKILEIETDTQLNKTIFESFKKKLKERYES